MQVCFSESKYSMMWSYVILMGLLVHANGQHGGVGSGPSCESLGNKLNSIEESIKQMQEKLSEALTPPPTKQSQDTTTQMDRCPNQRANPDYIDEDKDNLGNVIDNCPYVYNPNQTDTDRDLVGDACDTNIDTDHDGVQDDLDNCISVPNSDQHDADGDGLGDECDPDMDDDSIKNAVDNCPLVPNPDQLDTNRNSVGDRCEDDYDGDQIPNQNDNCPKNSGIHSTHFRTFQAVLIPHDTEPFPRPHWVISNNGTTIIQNKHTANALAVGFHRFGGVDFEGTTIVNDDDDDYFGFVFGYQNSAKFYVVMWKRKIQDWVGKLSEAGLQLKLVQSNTGPGNAMVEAMWLTGDTKNQVKLLWEDPKHFGWHPRTAYRWHILHRPNIGLIRIKIFLGYSLVTDSGNIYDSALKGGRLGVYCYAQAYVTWSDLVYSCNDKVPGNVYNELPPSLQRLVQKDN